MRASRRKFAALLFICLLGISTTARQAGAQTSMEPVRGRHGMVASSEAIASQVGVNILKKGGNAVDAAVAVGLALAVTHPAAGNLGGGGFMLIRMADGRTTVLDYREVAPAAARRTMYLDASGNLIPNASLVGHRAVGVPGTVAGFALALAKYGSLPWREVIEPARKLAAEGFGVDRHFAQSLRSAAGTLRRFPDSLHIFLRDGRYYEAGETFRQPELAATLQRLQQQGPREFYTGRTAQLITAEMQANGGLITREDLKRYRAVERRPLRGTYRGYEILTMPPPSSGGIALLETLNILENFDLAAMGRNSPERVHILIEAMRRAFADRAEFPGDPDFVQVPAAGLTSKRYAAALAGTIDRNRASRSVEVGHGSPVGYESAQTTHFSVVDAQGNAVSNTYTLNNLFGSGVTVQGAGFLLNDEMDDFTSKPGSPNLFGLIQGENNAIAPHKRPLSSMTPTIVLKGGKLLLVIGSPGGPTIITTVLQVILNVVEDGMNLRQAIAAPRLHHQWMPDVISAESNGLSEEMITALKAEGYVFAARTGKLADGDWGSAWGDAEGVMIDPVSGLRLGASDPRNGRSRAVGY